MRRDLAGFAGRSQSSSGFIHSARMGVLLLGNALMYNSAIMKLAAVVSLLGVSFLSTAAADGQPLPRRISVWLIPTENAGPNDIAQGENIPKQLDSLRTSLAQTRVRLLNVEDPLAMKARSWNPEFNVPNFQVVATQHRTYAALSRFAELHKVEVVARLVTWDEAFGLLSSTNGTGPDALPDLAQVGTSWSGYFAANRRIRSRPDWRTSRGNWRDVLGVPASALPYTNDVRLLFYWKRLPSAPPGSAALELNGASWPALLDRMRMDTGAGDTVAFATGITLNLLHDYASLVWAGGKPGFLSIGMFGPSVDFTSGWALSVPSFLATHTRIPDKDGVLRRLLTFPESSHEEVTRTFVNGGYRATLEPANFIGRWAEDFEQRQLKREQEREPRRRFWDYAAAVVPPENFKGGSELVVSSTAPDPSLAFALADYLATDPEYTRVLAEAGYLPAGRPGYGIDALVGTLASGSDVADQGTRVFSEAVQKAIDQGHKYPDFEWWPLAVENSVVLEKLQRVWRRMAQGDVHGLSQAAAEVEWAVNSRIYGPARTWAAFLQSWFLVVLVGLLLGGYAIWTYWAKNRSLRRLTTLLHLYRANRHESAKILGDNLVGLVSRRNAGEIQSEELTGKLAEVATHYRDCLGPYMSQLGEDLVNEVQGGQGVARLDEVVNAAWNGAKLHFCALRLMETPEVSFAAAGMSAWVIRKYPSMAKVVLQEWFFNCLRTLHRMGRAASIAVTVSNNSLIILSPGQLRETDVKTLTGKPSKGKLDADAHGLVLIRDITFYAFGSRVRIRQDVGGIRLVIPLKLSKCPGELRNG